MAYDINSISDFPLEQLV